VRSCRHIEEVMKCKSWNEFDLSKPKMRDFWNGCPDSAGVQSVRRKVRVVEKGVPKMKPKVVWKIKTPGLPGKIRFEADWKDFREVKKGIRESDERILPARFWNVVYNDPLLTQHRLKRVMLNNPSFLNFEKKLALHATIDPSQNRLWFTNMYMSASPAQCYWWIFWQDFWSNNYDMRAFKDANILARENARAMNKYVSGFVQKKILTKLGAAGETDAVGDLVKDNVAVEVADEALSGEDVGILYKTFGASPFAESIRYNFPKYTGE